MISQGSHTIRLESKNVVREVLYFYHLQYCHSWFFIEGTEKSQPKFLNLHVR